MCGGGSWEDSRAPNVECTVWVVLCRKILSTSVTGYETDPMTSDPAVD